MASLTETAKAVLEGKQLNEGIPAITPLSGGVSNPNPVDSSTASTGNAKTLRPGSKSVDSRHANPGAPAPSSFDGVEDLDGATPTEVADENLGAKASGKTSKDTSKSSASSVKGEPMHKLSVAEEMEEEGEVVAENEEQKAEGLAARIARVKKMAHSLEEAKKEKEKEDSAEDEDEDKAEKEDKEDKKEMDENFELSEELDSFIDQAIEEGLNEEEILAAIEENFEFVTEEDAFENYQVDMSEHVDALLAGENLSEDFHEKATVIFEAAVKAKLEEEVALLEQAYAETLEERVAEIMEQLSADVDNYLNYVVEQWIEENEVAVESALRSELTEDFIGGLRSLFAEHYIDVPEEEVHVVEELSQTVAELETKLNEEIERNVALSGALNESRKGELISYVCEGLTNTQAEKLKALTEGVAYTNDDEFIAKISTLRENYFPTAVNSDKVLDSVDEARDPQMIKEETFADLNGPMANYVKALGRSLPK